MVAVMKEEVVYNSEDKDHPLGALEERQPRVENDVATAPPPNGNVQGDMLPGQVAVNNEDEDDSEAETEILSDKEDTGLRQRIIRHEAGKKSDDAATSRASEREEQPRIVSSSRASSESALPSELVSRKRKIGNGYHGERPQKRRVRASVDITRNFTSDFYEERSNSPPIRQRRTRSLQSGEAPPTTRRRTKIPSAADEDSDHSTSTVQQSLNKVASVDSFPSHMVKSKKDKIGRTPLAQACAKGSIDAVLLILEERPDDINIADYAGNTPLQIASIEGYEDVVRALLQARCDVMCKNASQDTPLIDAAENGHLAVIIQLLDAGADPRQANAKGQEPLQLLDSDHEDFEANQAALRNAISKKATLESARPTETPRRPSDDQQLQRNSTGYSAVGSPANYTKQGHIAAKPISTRRERTRDDLLWVKPSPEKLRDAASTGDRQLLQHILNITSRADLDAEIAAAGGCHYDCLNDLMALPEKQPSDPDPVPSPNYPEGRNTPMLAAIGVNNPNSIAIIKLLLQDGFDASRRLYQGKAYFEIAEERQGINWQTERDILKAAYDEAVRKSTLLEAIGSDRNDHVAKIEKLLSEPEIDPTLRVWKGKTNHEIAEEREGANWQAEDSLLKGASDATTKKKALNCAETLGPGRQNTQIKREDSFQRRTIDGRNGIRRKRDTSGATTGIGEPHLRVPENPESREASSAPSDRESSPAGSRLKTRARRSLSDADRHSKDLEKQKPRRKLVSGKTLKDDEERKRKAPATSPLSEKDVPDHKKIRSSSPNTAENVPSKQILTSRARQSPENTAKQSIVDLNGHASPTPESDLEAQNLYERTDASSVTSAAPIAPIIPSTSTSRQASAPMAFMGVSAPNLDLYPQDIPMAESDATAESDIVHETDTPRSETNGHNATLNAVKVADHVDNQETRARKRAEQIARARQLELQAQEDTEKQRKAGLPNALRIAAALSRKEACTADELEHWVTMMWTATGEQIKPACEPEARQEKWIINFQAACLLGITDLNLSQFTAWERVLVPAEKRRRLCILWKVRLSRGYRVETWPTKFGPFKLKINPDNIREEMEWSATEEYHAVKDTDPKMMALEPVFWIKHSDLMEMVGPRFPHLVPYKARLERAEPVAW